MSRRDFVTAVSTVVGSIIGAAIGLPAIGYLISPALKQSASEAWIPAGPLENYPVGVPTPFNFTRTKLNGWEKTVNSYGVFIVHKDDGTALIIDNRCTHLGCRVNWKDSDQAYICPCHDAAFARDGAIMHGPQPTPLRTLESKVEEGNLFIFYQEGAKHG
jgi:Rieske Fe-S protein